MTNETVNTVWIQGLDDFRQTIASYQGTGQLVTGNGRRIDCAFHAGQFQDGRIIVVCLLPLGSTWDLHLHPPSSLRGRTADGHRISINGGGMLMASESIPLLPASTSNESVILSFNEIRVWIGNEPPVRVVYGLTNLTFKGTTTIQRTVPVRLSSGRTSRVVTLRSVSDYDQVLRGLRVTRGVAVTAEALVPLHATQQLSSLDRTMDYLCYVVSVARGCRVNWLYREVQAANGNATYRLHGARVTRAYGELQPISGMDNRAMQAFIEAAYPTFVSRRSRFALDHGAIDLYLDARSSEDYLQTRGAKMAIALESLKAVHLRVRGHHGQILEPDTFRQVRSHLRRVINDTLLSHGVSEDDAERVLRKVNELNRLSFRDVMTELFEELSFRPHKREVGMFVAYRNKLVHEGRFYCESATPEERKNTPALPTVIDEFLFLCAFLDRVMLSLLGYFGMYSDYSSSRTDYVRDRLVNDNHWPHPLLANKGGL